MRLDGVGKRYRIRGPWVLRDVHLRLPPGRVVRVSGENGSGKSTLLRLVAGIATPTRGRVSGRPSTGYVPERFTPALPFTAARYLRHHARLRGVATDSGLHWLERFGAADFADTPMKALSKGTSQKVALAQAFMADPGLLVLDEASTGLDDDGRREMEDVVRERALQGARVVFVDHDPARLADVTDERWRVDGGTLTAVEGDVRSRGRVSIDVSGLPEGPESTWGLPATAHRASDGRGGHRITVDGADSDNVLRLLLGLGTHVHITSVERSDR